MQRPSVEDRLLIEDLYARYAWALDTGDTDAYVELYAPNAVVYESRPEGLRRADGREEVREFVLRFHANPEFPGRQHRTSQLMILPDPEGREDHWRARSYVLTTAFKDAGPPTLFWCGHVDDILVKLEGEWLIERREIKPWSGDVLERFV